MINDEEIYLRNFQLGDAAVLYKWGQDAHFHKLAGFNHFNNYDEALQAVKQYAKRKYSYAICLKNDDKVIGLIELYERGLDERSGLLNTKEIGFLIDSSYQGQGLMKKAIKLVLNYAFIKLNQTEIWAGVFEENIRSQKLLEALGFKYVYEYDMNQISEIFSYKEKYYLLKKAEWLKIDENTKS